MKYYKDALYLAVAKEYQDEIIDTDMEDSVIGEWKDFSSKEEWIQARVDEYLEEAALERAGKK